MNELVHAVQFCSHQPFSSLLYSSFKSCRPAGSCSSTDQLKWLQVDLDWLSPPVPGSSWLITSSVCDGSGGRHENYISVKKKKDIFWVFHLQNVTHVQSGDMESHKPVRRHHPPSSSINFGIFCEITSVECDVCRRTVGWRARPEVSISSMITPRFPRQNDSSSGWITYTVIFSAWSLRFPSLRKYRSADVNYVVQLLHPPTAVSPGKQKLIIELNYLDCLSLSRQPETSEQWERSEVLACHALV